MVLSAGGALAAHLALVLGHQPKPLRTLHGPTTVSDMTPMLLEVGGKGMVACPGSSSPCSSDQHAHTAVQARHWLWLWAERLGTNSAFLMSNWSCQSMQSNA